MSDQSESGDESALDFSSEVPSEDELPGPQLGGTYDPRPQEDSARRYIAYALIGLLWLVVAAMLILTASRVLTPNDIKEFSVILGPIVTLVSAATGFYYGTKTNGR
jgi:hypothetical protein